ISHVIDESGVTYTEVSNPFEDLSDIGSPRADDHEHLELPGILEDPYIEVALQAPPSLDYIPSPEELEQAPPLPDYVLGLEHADDEIVAEDQPYAEDASPTAQAPEYVPESDLEAYLEEDDDEDPEEDSVDHPANGGDKGDDEEGSSKDDDMDIKADEEEKEEEEEHPAPADSTACYVYSTIITIIPIVFTTASDSFSTTTPDNITTLTCVIPAPPPSPIRSLGYRAAMIRLRAEVTSTSYSPPIPPPFILSPTRSDAPSSGILPPLPISAPTSLPPLQLPSASRTEDRPEVTLPPRKRLGITLGPGYEGDQACPEREVGYGITDSWDEIVETLQGAPSERQLLAGRLNMLFRDRRAHAYTSHLMLTEARLSREAWVRSMDASDLARGEVMSLRTTVLGQMIEIRELHVADRRRQIVTSEILRADHKRFADIRGLRTVDHTRQQQLIQTWTMMQSLQRQVTLLQGHVLSWLVRL
nr:hypothetical protein [Tanacetum cinerariifolium]